MQEQTKPKQVTVQAYSFADALTELQSYVKQGYEVDVETNGTYPMLIGSLMIFSVILKEDGVVPKDGVQEASEPPTAAVSTELGLTTSEPTEMTTDNTLAKRGRTKSLV